jgi:hypothetical protein
MEQATPLRALPAPITGPPHITDLDIRRHDRLGDIIHGRLKTRTLYDETTAWSQRPTPRRLTSNVMGCLTCLEDIIGRRRPPEQALMPVQPARVRGWQGRGSTAREPDLAPPSSCVAVPVQSTTTGPPRRSVHVTTPNTRGASVNIRVGPAAVMDLARAVAVAALGEQLWAPHRG